MRTPSAVLLFALASCGADAGDRVLQDVAYGVALPNFRDFAEKAGDLARAAEGGDLEAARVAWRAARGAWTRCLGHLVGPEAGRLLHAKVDTHPASGEKLARLLASGEALDDAALERLGADVKGFFAIEAIAFDARGDARRSELLIGLARNLERTAREILEGWEDGKGGFAGRLARAGRPGSGFASRQEAYDLLLNHLVVVAQVLPDRLARPAGLTASADGRPDPSLIVARKSGHAVEEIVGAVDGLRRLYEGGLALRVSAASPELDVEIRKALELAKAEAGALPEPLEAALGSEAARKAVAALRNLQNRIAIDLVGVYRTTLTVSPFDGD